MTGESKFLVVSDLVGRITVFGQTIQAARALAAADLSDPELASQRQCTEQCLACKHGAKARGQGRPVGHTPPQQGAELIRSCDKVLLAQQFSPSLGSYMYAFVQLQFTVHKSVSQLYRGSIDAIISRYVIQNPVRQCLAIDSRVVYSSYYLWLIVTQLCG